MCFLLCEFDVVVKEGYVVLKWIGEVMFECLVGKGVIVVIYRLVLLYMVEDGKGEVVKVVLDVVGILLWFSFKMGVVFYIFGLEVEGNVDMVEVGRVVGDVVVVVLVVD